MCWAQIIDAQKARQRRELETLQVSLRKTSAEKERANTVVCQLRADLADMSAERDATTLQDQQHAEQQRQRICDLEGELQHAVCSHAGANQPQTGKENQYAEVSSLSRLQHLS